MKALTNATVEQAEWKRSKIRRSVSECVETTSARDSVRSAKTSSQYLGRRESTKCRRNTDHQRGSSSNFNHAASNETPITAILTSARTVLSVISRQRVMRADAEAQETKGKATWNAFQWAGQPPKIVHSPWGIWTLSNNNNNNNNNSRASFLAACHQHSRDWLFALPIASCGLKL